MNTANAWKVNSQHSVTPAFFEVSALVQAGDELCSQYCKSCANDEMLLLWGVYLDENPNSISGHSVDCRQLSKATQEALDFAPKRLKAGTRVTAKSPSRRDGGSKFYPGIIRGANPDSTHAVDFDD